jgi:hypothetical protein
MLQHGDRVIALLLISLSIQYCSERMPRINRRASLTPNHCGGDRLNILLRLSVNIITIVNSIIVVLVLIIIAGHDDSCSYPLFNRCGP